MHLAGGLAAAFDPALVLKLAASDTYRSRRIETIRARGKHRETQKRKRKNKQTSKKVEWLGEGETSKTLHTAAPTFGRLPAGSDLVGLRDVAYTQSKDEENEHSGTTIASWWLNEKTRQMD